MDISYPVVELENTVYEVILLADMPGWLWKGNIGAKGEVTEITAFNRISDEESLKTAGQFVKYNPTFLSDGMPETLVLEDPIAGKSPY